LEDDELAPNFAQKNLEKAFLYRMISLENKPHPPFVNYKTLMAGSPLDPEKVRNLGKEIPILVIAGTEDLLWSVGGLENIASHLGGFFKICPGVGHSPAFENPEWFNHEVEEFIGRKKE